MSRRVRISRTTFVLAAVVGITLGTFVTLRLGAVAQVTSYALTDFKIDYPYDDPRDEVLPSSDAVAVSFLAHWPDSGFPGTGECTVTLTSADGKEVGALAFELVSGTDGATTGPMLVTVSGDPSSASGACVGKSDEADTTTGAGYVVSGPTKITEPVNPITREAIPDLTELQFDVRWERSGENPGMRSCSLVVERADGTEDPPVEFLMLSDEEPITKEVEGSPDTVASARITCGPVEG